MTKPEAMFERPLPQALDAERMVIGSLLAGHSSVADVAALVSPDDLCDDRHRRIYRQILSVDEAGEAVNRITVMQGLHEAGLLEAVGGAGYIVDLEGDSVKVNLDSYIRIIRKISTFRRLIFATNSLMHRAMAAEDSPAELIEEAEEILAKIGESAEPRVKLKTPLEIIEGYPGGVNAFLDPYSNRVGIPLPWPSVAEIVPVFRDGQLVIIAARPGAGKSVAATQIVTHACSIGKGSALFSLEMGGAEILQRMIAARAEVDSFKWQQGYAGKDERLRLMAATTAISQYSGLWIDDTTGCSVPALQAAVRKRRAASRVDIVVVDYLQLMEAPGRFENRVQEVTSISRGLKRMAREFQIPVVALSQLNRASLKDNEPPDLHHLRESGSLEQDADVVIMQHPRSKADDEAKIAETEFYVRKHRGGPKGKKTLTFNKPFCRFEDTAAREPNDD